LSFVQKHPGNGLMIFPPFSAKVIPYNNWLYILAKHIYIQSRAYNM